MEKELESLDSYMRRIRQECKSLDDNVVAVKEGKVSDAYLAGHFNYVEKLFDDFRAIVQATGLSDDVLEPIQKEANEIYQHVCSLRSSEEQPFDEQQVLMQQEEQDTQVPSQPQQEQRPENEAAIKDRKQHRTVRKLQALVEAEQNRQQLQWEKAVSVGMSPVPGQVITEAGIQDFQVMREMEQERKSQNADENRTRAKEQLQSYRQYQQELSNQKSIGNSHIDMSRDIFGRKNSVPTDLSFQQFPALEHFQETVGTPAYKVRLAMEAQSYRENQSWKTNVLKSIDSENVPESTIIPMVGHPEMSDTQHHQSNRGPTKAERAALSHTKSQHRYELKSILRCKGNLSYVMFARGVQRATRKLDNDAVQAMSSGIYYISTAYGAARIVLPTKPTGALLKSAQQITGKQLAAQRNNLIRQNRELNSQISTLEHQLQRMQNEKKPAQRQKIQQISTQLSELRSKLPAIQKELKSHEWVRTFQHQRMLDQQIIKELTVNGKIPRNVASLQELSRSALKKREEKILEQYGKWNQMPSNRVPEQIQRMKDQGAHIKKKIQLLQGKGTLTAQERDLLLKLKRQNKEIGNRIASLTEMLHSKEDLDYIQSKIAGILKRANQNRQRTIGTAFFLRNLALRPVQAGTESNTEWLSKAVSFTTDPRTIRYTRKAVSGMTRIVGKTFPKVAPTADNWIRYKVSQKKTAVRKTMKSFKSEIKKSTPPAVKKVAHNASAPIRGVQKIGTGIHNRVFAVKRRFADTRVGMLLQKQRYMMQTAGHAMQSGVYVLKGLAIKALLVFAVAFLIAGLIAGAAGMIAGSVSSTMIMSPQVDSNGKINLAPYTQIVKSEISAFNGRVDQLHNQYENNSNYDNVEVVYSSINNNMREVLSMMAVRMQQNLDTGSNANVDPYIRYLVDISHAYKISEHQYYCSGCQYRPCTPPESSIEDNTDNTEPQMELYCPGHIDVTITVTVCSFDEMMAQDSYITDDGWSGWDETNITWCQTIYSMDWAELYSGLDIGHGGTIGTIISAEDEAHIWDSLLSMIGNPFGAAGLMGNLYAESGLSSTNLQDSYEKLLGYDDMGYTNAIDTGNYRNFADDWAGYGLAQWTDPSRKNNLYRFAKSQGVSIGNLDMQLEFLQKELSETAILPVLQKTMSVREASDEVLVNFERPADQSESVKITRSSFGEYFYNKYQRGIESEGDLTQKQIDVIRVATNSQGYGIPAEKGMCQAWAANVYEKAGLPTDYSSSALASGRRYGVSEDFSVVPPGAAVYGYASNPYGHVGIYVGNGLVYHNIGGVAVDTLADWIRIYNGFCWGWQAGTDLTIP